MSNITYLNKKNKIYLLIIFVSLIFLFYKYNYNYRKGVRYIINSILYTNNKFHYCMFNGLPALKSHIEKFYKVKKIYPTNIDEIYELLKTEKYPLVDCWGNLFKINEKYNIIYSSGPDWESNYENINDPSNEDDLCINYKNELYYMQKKDGQQSVPREPPD